MAAPTLFPESGFRRLRLDIAYDGTHFFGWATQPGHRTLQDLIEEAISRISQTNIDSIVAGRTDAGVHATGQVIHVDVPDAMFDRELTYLDLRYKLNRILDEDVRIMNVSDAPKAFMPVFLPCAGITATRFSITTMSSHHFLATMSHPGIAHLTLIE